MRKILITILTLISINSFSQQWTEHQVDSTLSLTLPDNYKVIDTLGQRIITAQVDNGTILITVLPNTGELAINIQDEKDLIDSYTEFRKALIMSSNGQLIKEEIIDRSGLKLARITYHATMGDERQIRNCLVISVNGKTYAIGFYELESLTNEMSGEREKLFSSLKLQPGLALKNQMSSTIEDSGSHKMRYALMFALFILLIYWISKRGKKKKAVVS